MVVGIAVRTRRPIGIGSVGWARGGLNWVWERGESTVRRPWVWRERLGESWFKSWDAALRGGGFKDMIWCKT